MIAFTYSLCSYDGRASNSRSGKGIGANKFESFCKGCQEILLPDSAADECRHGNNAYSTAANSILNLIKQATDNLEMKACSNEIVSLPPAPSEEWVHLQFVPSIASSALVARFTGRPEVKRAAQT